MADHPPKQERPNARNRCPTCGYESYCAGCVRKAAIIAGLVEALRFERNMHSVMESGDECSALSGGACTCGANVVTERIDAAIRAAGGTTP